MSESLVTEKTLQMSVQEQLDYAMQEGVNYQFKDLLGNEVKTDFFEDFWSNKKKEEEESITKKEDSSNSQDGVQ